MLVLCILMGLMFINGGLNKIFHYIPEPELTGEVLSIMTGFNATGWLFPLIAVTEIMGGALFMIPRTRALGAIILFPVMIGIVLFHIFQDPSTIAIALVVFVINGWVIWENRAKYLPMIRG